ncbi:sulfatase-like hydrolase/transferase [uncultured Draconibacterium sp.]|uniref:sulfatase-like hydrolase/transferase n=1 Tax=uncultured Draconibacterium sp. TaxID=1573823 RepID=UPI0029C7B67D|nr:sulfatase-like hydrolase/transferase [uncultured Draconibacterium sp.]
MLIVRADDMGSSHAANLACIESAKNGIATSIELMVPCPWFDEAVTLLNNNPGIDVGVHLTLTAEWPNYKWKPITACRAIVDTQGNFFPRIWPNEQFPGQSVKETAGNMAEIEKELRAQIELALKKIPHISHLTEHMGCLQFSEEAKALGRKLAKEYNLPIELNENVKRAPKWSGNISSEKRIENLIAMLDDLQPGSYLTVEHPAYDVPEIKAIEPTGDVARNRQGVTDAYTNSEVIQALKKKNMKLLSYKQVHSEAKKAVVNYKTPKRTIKNVVVIIADDHALKVTGCYGNSIIRTPNIDKLAEQGTTFSNAYCNSPICSASRQSLLTGKYPHATGVNLLFTPFPDEGNITIAEHLKEQGYNTGLIGKTHWNNWAWASLYKDGMPNHGFNTRIEGGQYKEFLKENPMPKLPQLIETYSKEKTNESIPEWMNARCLPQPVYDEFSEGTFYANQASKFIAENGEQPFFLWVAFKEPHHPYYFPIEYQGKYKPENMPLPKGSPEDDRWIPAKFKNLSDAEKKGIIASYYTSTEYLDKNIGLVLDALKKNNLEENTLVVYISDNGYLLNEHKRFEKHTMWEEATHQPMIFKIPGGKKGIQKNALVEYVDVVPTILELTQNNSLDEAQGKSFASLLSDSTDQHRDYVFSEYLQDNMAMVATKDWKYIFHTGSRDLSIGYATGSGPSGIFHGLYNLNDDPTEGKNEANNKKNKNVLTELQNVMLQHFNETHPDAADCPQGLTLPGKLVWFCEPRDVGAEQNPEAKPVRVFK